MAYKRISPQPVVEGGTGAQTLTSHGVLLGNTTGAITATAAGTTGQVLTGVTGSAPTFQTPAASGIVTANGDSGSATGSTVTWNANTNSGQTVKFTATGATVSLNVSDASSNTFMGAGTGKSGYTTNQSTAFGATALSSITSGNYNNAFGNNALNGMTTGVGNCAFGTDALYATSGGNYNFSAGLESLFQLNSGSYNICIGRNSGFNYTGTESSNIILGDMVQGTVSESNVLRIGSATGTSSGNLNSAFIQGITGITVTGTPVLVSAAGQLGIAASSAKFKQDIQDMGDQSNALLQLRPVTFKWNKDSAPGLKDDDGIRQFGLIAQEVASVMPDLVVRDDQGEPLSVKYQDLPAILLNELQKALKRIEALEAKTKG